MSARIDSKIGTRWQEFLERVKKLREVEEDMGHVERLFLRDAERRLTRYEGDTILTRKQRNWLTHLETDYLEPGDATL